MTAHRIASKFRRALRNGTGANFTNDELRELGRMGVPMMLAEAEARELCGEPFNTERQSGQGGRGEGKPAPPLSQSDGKAYIEALTSCMPSRNR